MTARLGPMGNSLRKIICPMLLADWTFISMVCAKLRGVTETRLNKSPSSAMLDAAIPIFPSRTVSRTRTTIFRAGSTTAAAGDFEVRL